MFLVKKLAGFISSLMFIELVPTGNLLNITMAEGREKEMEYDKLNRVTKIIDEGGNLHEYGYDLNGNLTRKFKASGLTEQYTHNSSNQITTMSSDGKTYNLTYNPAGQMTGITGSDFSLTQEFDANGRLLKQAFPKTGDEMQYVYDKTGKLIKVSHGDSTLQYAYNKQGRVNTIIRDDVQIGFSYDDAGRKTNVSYESVKFVV